MTESLTRAKVGALGTLEVALVAFLFIIASRYWDVSEHVVYISIFCAMALIALTRWRTGNHSLRGFLPLAAFSLFLGWAVLSATWSPTVHLSLARAVTVALVAAIAVLVGLTFKTASVAKGLVVGVVVLIAHASLNDGLGVLGFLALGSEPGLFTNISSMTFLLGVGVIASLAMAWSKKSFFLVSLPLGLIFAVTAFGIEVTTTYLATMGGVVVGLMVLHLRYVGASQRRIFSVVYPLVVLVAATLFWFLRDPISALLNQDPALSGRTIIWEWFFEAFLWHPIIGVGWGTSYNLPVTRGDTFPTGEYFMAHNGFIDIGLVTGGVGVALIIATLVLLFIRGATLAMDRSQSVSYLFVPALVTYIVLNDIMATSLPRSIGVFLVGIMVGLVAGGLGPAELKTRTGGRRSTHTPVASEFAAPSPNSAQEGQSPPNPLR